MRRGLLSLLATLLAIPVLMGVLSDSYTLEVAALRLAVLAAAVLLVDRLVAPAVAVLMTVVKAPPVGSEDRQEASATN